MMQAITTRESASKILEFGYKTSSIVSFHLYEIARINKSTDVEADCWLPEYRRRRNGE